MHRSLALPLALLVAFFLGGVSGNWTVRAQDEDESPPKHERPARKKPGGDKPPLVWERLNTQTGGGAASLRCSRSKIAGGWLVLIERVHRPRRGKAAEGAKEEKRPKGPVTVTPTLTFVPDPTHGWDGGSPQ